MKLNRREFVTTAALPFVSHPSPKEAQAGPEAPPLYLADLDRCRPQTALSSEPARFHWRTLPYRTPEFSGVMLMAGQETQAPEVVHPLGRRGWHDIYIGVFSTAWRPYESTRLWLKLETAPAFSLLHVAAPPIAKQQQIQDVFWKTARLNGEGIAFKQVVREVVSPDRVYGDVCDIIWVAYVKLVAASEEKVQQLEEERTSNRHKRLFATNDAWSFHYEALGEVSEQAIRRQLEPYRETDFQRIYWEAARGDLCNYFTRSGRPWFGPHMKIADFPRTGDRLVLQRWQQYFQKGIDPLRVAVDFSHEIGLEFHASYRLGGGGMGAFYYSPPFDIWNRGGFYENHPELRCIRRDGTPAPRISYAFDETRRFILSLFDEIVSNYPVDGLALLFNRRPPVVEYEAPLVEGFQREFGQDPRRLPESDPRWLHYRSRTVTQFLRELRERLKALGKESREVSAWVFGTEEENLFYALDVKTWMEERLIDTLIPYTSAPGLFSWQMAWEKPEQVRYWVSLTGQNRCKLALNVMPRNLSWKQYRRKAYDLYHQGVEHLAFWDSSMVEYPSFDSLRRLGHKEELEQWVRGGEPDLPASSVSLISLQDWEMTFIPE